MLKVLLLFLGGGIGSLSRYLVSFLSDKIYEGFFPLGTFIVNMAGAFVIGLLWGLFEFKTISPELKSFIFAGFLGGFTTFSTLMLDSMKFFKEKEFIYATVNIILSNALGIIMVFIGYFITKSAIESIIKI